MTHEARAEWLPFPWILETYFATRQRRGERKKEKRKGKKAGNSPASERTRGTNHSACFRVKPVAISKPDTTLVHLALALFPPSPSPWAWLAFSFDESDTRHARRGGEDGGGVPFTVVSTPAAKSRAAPCNDDELALLRHYSVPLDTIVRATDRLRENSRGNGTERLVRGRGGGGERVQREFSENSSGRNGRKAESGRKGKERVAYSRSCSVD